jgi:hypothetical protein
MAVPTLAEGHDRAKLEWPVQHYSLDAILAVGFRVRSHRGTEFRKWATRVYPSTGHGLHDG